MVLDILDTLTHPERYDEFIVLSVDADFTPVLLRLREHDRRTAMLVSGPAAAALRHAAYPSSITVSRSRPQATGCSASNSTSVVDPVIDLLSREALEAPGR